MRLPKILVALLSLVPALACSSGLGGSAVCSTAPVGSVSGNLTTGLFFGFELADPVEEHAAAGGLIPGSTQSADRHVIFHAFVTRAPADDAGAPGSNQWLDRDGVPDLNGKADVFLAAVVDRAIDQRAFSYSLAGKFRHPRCMSCHSLAEADQTVFAAGVHFGPDPSDPAIQDVPASLTNSCMGCHRFALDKYGTPETIGAWRNPPTSVDADFRKLSTKQLAQRARGAPVGHFSRDRRIDWALSSGVLTYHSNYFEISSKNNGIFKWTKSPFGAQADHEEQPAYDDRDGEFEVFEADTRRRLVPGGRKAFLTEIEAFLCGGPTDTRAAIADVALVSRRMAVAQAGSGASGQPDVAYVPDAAYVPGKAGWAGEVFVAFASDANDLAGILFGNLDQVYRARFDVTVGGNGSVDLVYRATELVSYAGTGGGDDHSEAPSVSASGDRVAFASRASDILPPSGGGVSHVYVREVSTGDTARVSENGTADSIAPAIDPTGTVVAFESLFDFPDGGSPGEMDVYYARLSEPISLGVAGGFPRLASKNNMGLPTTGASSQPAVVLTATGEVLVAFASLNDLDPVTFGDPTTPENVYVHRDDGVQRSTTLVSVAENSMGVVELPDGSSRAPAFVGPDRLLIETDATNLDSSFLLPPDPLFGPNTFASGDENGGADVIMLRLKDWLDGSGPITAEAVSVSPAGAFGDRGSCTPVAGTFALPVSAGPSTYRGFAALMTLARNLGAADNHDELNPADPTPWLAFIADD